MKYHQGKYIPENPDKYLGDVNSIIYRSSWELKFCQYLDKNSDVISWASEEIVLPYISPIDNKRHRYFLDFYMKYKDKNGNIRESIIEIKPYKETQKPKGKRITEKQITTYIINCAKWHAASKFAKQNNIEFKLMTEKDLGIK